MAAVWAYQEGYAVFAASDWQLAMAEDRPVGSWMCGYCEKFSVDHQSPNQGQTLATCQHCGHPNRISLD
jgi:hypothetical protein